MNAFARLAAFLFLMALAGCLSPGPGPVANGTSSVAVQEGAVIVSGPPGYCVDTGASRPGARTSFVLLGACASITGDARAPSPAVPGVLSISVEPDGGEIARGRAALDRLRTFVTSAEGRALLARDGQPGSVEVMETQIADDALFVRLRDKGVAATGGLDAQYWRGFADLGGRLATLSAMSFADRPQGRDTGLSTLRAFLGQVRGGVGRPVSSVEPASGTPPRRGILALFQ